MPVCISCADYTHLPWLPCRKSCSMRSLSLVSGRLMLTLALHSPSWLLTMLAACPAALLVHKTLYGLLHVLHAADIVSCSLSRALWGTCKFCKLPPTMRCGAGSSDSDSTASRGLCETWSWSA